MGAAKAVDVANLSDKVIIGGYDGDVSALEYLAKCNGPFIATATQSTQKMGVLAVEVGDQPSPPARKSRSARRRTPF